MDLVKRGRTRIAVGDCVSLPTSYWGTSYACNDVLKEQNIHRLYGRVSKIDQFNLFTVVWDIDQQVSDKMSLNISELRHEPLNTPKQLLASTAPSVGSIDVPSDPSNPIEVDTLKQLLTSTASSVGSSDPSNPVEVQEQCSSATRVNEEHALVVEDMEYSLLDDLGNDVYKGVMVHTQPGALVHNKPMGAGFAKFRVTAVIDDAYDSDVTEDAYVPWELSKTKAPGSFTHIKGRGLRVLKPMNYCNGSRSNSSSTESESETSRSLDEGKKVKRKRKVKHQEAVGKEKVEKENHWNM